MCLTDDAGSTPSCVEAKCRSSEREHMWGAAPANYCNISLSLVQILLRKIHMHTFYWLDEPTSSSLGCDRILAYEFARSFSLGFLLSILAFFTTPFFSFSSSCASMWRHFSCSVSNSFRSSTVLLSSPAVPTVLGYPLILFPHITTLNTQDSRRSFYSSNFESDAHYYQSFHCGSPLSF